ncbi:MAG: hypothetical protein E7360_00770 [Clostridiales bacterium]|nr:hypothetical protein [Clostridiales bacterium]
MNIEIVRILGIIKEKTGKEVRVYTETEDEFYSTVDAEIPERFLGRVTQIEFNENNGKIYFPFKHNAVRYVGYIDGATAEEKPIASLIATILENGIGREKPTNKAEALRSAIVGESSAISVQKTISKFSVSNMPCSALAVYVSVGKVKDVLDFMENFKSDENDLCVITDDFTCAYIRFGSSSQEGEYRSLTDYASLLAQTIHEELGIHVKIGVGSLVGGFTDCAVSYQQALTAIRMSGVFGEKSSVATYKEYVLIKMLEDLPKYKLQEFLEILEDPEAKSMFADGEMVTTAEEFLNTSLNVSETSRNLYMHRNTLMYRLDKIERATGLDIRKFQDAMTFRLIMILHKLLG